ncbi:hypothetical protein HMPREF9151_01576 [Hoylesella saccharolytica F0055]|uniref:Uncharacterized protein n=1 Tax=Hoylesella saccharolytica F0055 TaxID=1127699 RepID=L1N8G9_9BACT|nr:hypothetical protein HMPREF9151_01576 [Hoylesella saccharolytica F0055]
MGESHQERIDMFTKKDRKRRYLPPSSLIKSIDQLAKNGI